MRQDESALKWKDVRYLPVTSLNPQHHRTVWVIDDFYKDPYAVRDFALKQEFTFNPGYHEGQRTKKQFFVPGTKQTLERIMGIRITEWESHPMNGRFQLTLPTDDIVYHWDQQTWAALLYLTPDAPYECGTSLYSSKDGTRNMRDWRDDSVFGIQAVRKDEDDTDVTLPVVLSLVPTDGEGDIVIDGVGYERCKDRDKFNVVDSIGNVFNRLFIFDARCIHAASKFFGTNKEDARLFQVFFFD